MSHIYIEFWYRKDQGDLSKKKHLPLFNGKKKLGFGGHFGPDLATGPLFRPMLPVSTPELLSKCVPPLLTVLTVAGLQAGLIF